MTDKEKTADRLIFGYADERNGSEATPAATGNLLSKQADPILNALAPVIRFVGPGVEVKLGGPQVFRPRPPEANPYLQ